MKRTLALIAIIMQFHAITCQKEIWSLDVQKDAFMSQIETGQLLIKEKDKITLIDQKQGKSLWSNSVNTDKDPIFIDNSSIFYFSGNSYAIIDAATGKVLDKDERKTEILKIHYYDEIGKVIMEQDRDNNLYVTCIDLKNRNAISTKVAELKKSMFGLVKKTTYNPPSISNDGSIILVDKKAVCVIDALGQVKHRTEFEENLEKIDFNEYNNFLYVLEEKKLHFVNTNTGKVESTAKLEDDDFSFNIIDKGNVFALRDGKKLTLLDSKNGSTLINKKYDDKIKFTYFDTESDKYYLCIKKSILEIDQKTAETIRSAEVSKGIGPIYPINDRMFIGDNYKSNEIDLSSLKPKFVNPIPLVRVSDFISLENKNLYLNITPEITTMSMVSNDGIELWNKEYKLEYVNSVDLTPAGIFIMRSTFAELLNKETGKSVIKKSIETGPSMVYHLNEKKNIITFYSDKKIKSLNLNTGELNESKKEIEFKDFDYATQKPHIAINEKYIYLKGSNSVFITDLNGNILHEKHYKKTDNTSGWLKLATFAAAATAVGTGNADKVMTVYQGDNMVYKGDYVDGLNSVGNYADALQAKRQRQQNRGSAMYPYVHTKLEGDKRGLVFIDQESGNHKYEVIMPENDPVYIVDEIDGVLYYISQGKLKAFELK